MLKSYTVGLPCDPEVAKIHPPLDADGKWALFVKRATYRFESFWEGLEKARNVEGPGRFKIEELPPLGESCLVLSSRLSRSRLYFSLRNFFETS